MRRKSTRAAAKKAESPEKPATPRKSRRSSRRRKQSTTSEEEGSDSEYQVQQQSVEEPETDSKTAPELSDDDSKPLADIESNTRTRGRKRQSSNKEEENVEERVVITIRRRGRKAATPDGSHDDVSQDNEDDSNEYQVVQNSELAADVEKAADDEKKLKGKSKSRSKSKSEQPQQQAQQPPSPAQTDNEPLTETISDNAQVTQQSPPIVDKTVENTTAGNDNQIKCQNQVDDVSDEQCKADDKPKEIESMPEQQNMVTDENSVAKINEQGQTDTKSDEDNVNTSETCEKLSESVEKLNEQSNNAISTIKDAENDSFVSSYELTEHDKSKNDEKPKQQRRKITIEVADDSCQKKAENENDIVEKTEQVQIQRSVSEEGENVEQVITPRRLLKLKRTTSESQSESEPTPQKRQKWNITALEASLPVTKVDVEILREVLPKVEFLPEDELKLNADDKLAEKRRKTVSESSDRVRKSSSDSDSGPGKEFEAEDNADSKQSEDISNIIAVNRKISIVDDTASKLRPPPSPAQHPVSDVLFITNLVRPFTLKQLRELLERTGTIKEDGFWTDRIKSKCYVQYESSEEAETTRNALHGVHWPIGNGKKLIIDFATEEDLKKAKNPPPPPVAAVAPIVADKPIIDKENAEPERRVSEGARRRSGDKKPSPPPATRHVREWDLGKEDMHRKRSRSRSRSRERGRKVSRRSRSHSAEYPSRKHKKTEDPAPQKMMDDLFLKTKATPSIYWQPLSPEEILQKQQQRLIRMEEHKRRMEETARNRGGGRDGRDGRMGRGGSYRRR